MTQIESGKLDEVLELLKEHGNKLERIDSVLAGDKYDTTGGVIKRLDVIESRQDKVEEWVSKFKWISAAVITIFAFVEFLYQFTSVFNILFQHKK